MAFKGMRTSTAQKHGTAIHYSFTELLPPSIVKTDSDSGGFDHVSLRIRKQLRHRLKEEAKSRHVPLNSLINAILAKYDAFDKILEGTNAIPLSEAFFQELLETISIEEIESIANKLGAKVVRRSFAFRGIGFNLDNLIEFYFKPLSEHSGWYRLSTTQGAWTYYNDGYYQYAWMENSNTNNTSVTPMYENSGGSTYGYFNETWLSSSGT